MRKEQLIFLIIITLLPHVAWGQSPEVQARVKFERAKLAFEQRDYTGALETFEDLMPILGQEPVLMYNAAKAAYEAGYYEKATRYVYKVLETTDVGFKRTQNYEEAFRLAAKIEAKKEEEEAREDKNWVEISAGSFFMGSTRGRNFRDTERVNTKHSVVISQSYQLGKYEVTQARWEAVMGYNPSHYGGQNLPVESVTWNDVQSYIEALNERDRRYRYRLPTEAEWEYAARAGTKGDYSCDAEKTKVLYTVNHNKGPNELVGRSRPNAWGLYNMHDNVYEWVQDWSGEEKYSQKTYRDPQGPVSGTSRVVRGGCTGVIAGHRFPTNRHDAPPNTSTPALGFRLVRMAR